MKKGLFLLPLLAGFVCAGCEFELFGKKFQIGGNKDNNTQQNGTGTGTGTGGNTNTGGNDSSGGNTSGGGNTSSGTGDTVDVDSEIILDFTKSEWKDEKLTPYVEDNTTLQTFTYDGVTYNDKGCYANAYNGTYWLMMKNKWEDGKVVSGEEFAFIGNADKFSKPIKSIDVEVSVQTGAVDFVVSFGDSAFGSSSTDGFKYTAAASTSASFTATCSSNSSFFAISATKAVGQYRKNGGIAKVVIHF